MGLTKKVSIDDTRGHKLATDLKGQFNMLHSMDFYDDYEIEELLLRQKKLELDYIKKRFKVPTDFVQFSPSSADKCKRELFYKINKLKKDEQSTHPYQRRWTRNSTAVHEAVQRDLLYMEKHLPNPAFKVEMMGEGVAEGLPAWEKNLQAYKLIEHNGQKFYLYGMMDGILQYKDGSRIGFEFKTKSTKQDTIHKLKKPSPSHVQQTVAYSILFGIDEYLITYESVAKDEWRSGAIAYEDIKPFYVKVTEKQRIKLLDKFAEVAEMVNNGEIPQQETSKCFFCPYKSFCLGGNK